MPETTLHELLERNDRHVAGLADGYFADVESGQSPAAVSVCCSDSRVSQEGMWDVQEPGWLFTAGVIGNVAWDTVDDERVVAGSVIYPLAFTDTTVAIVVGHTGCGAVTAALQQVQGDDSNPPAGVAACLEQLNPVIEAGLADPRVNEDNEASLVDQLVEYNVDQQVAFLCENDEVPDDVAVYGFVYDFQRVYGETPGRVYLTNVNGETAPESIREFVPTDAHNHVRRLL